MVLKIYLDVLTRLAKCKQRFKCSTNQHLLVHLVTCIVVLGQWKSMEVRSFNCVFSNCKDVWLLLKFSEVLEVKCSLSIPLN